MCTDLRMPRLSDSMAEGLIVRWLKAPGEVLVEGDELVEIETDKATMVYEVDRSGILAEIVAAEGEAVPVGEIIARIGGKDSDVAAQGPSDADRGGSNSILVEPVAEVRLGVAPAPASNPGRSRVTASPVARRLAAKAGIDLASVKGSGPNGRISKRDIEVAMAATPATDPEGPDEQAGDLLCPSGISVETRQLSRLQTLVAERVTEAKASTPHFYLEMSVDVSELSAGLRRLKERRADDDQQRTPSVNDVIVKAAAIALRRHPKVNGAYRGGRWEIYPEVDIGIAVAVGEDLLVPVLPGADRRGLSEIATRSMALTEAARCGRLTPADLDGGTFTISNLGMFGVECFHAVINGGQAAILAVGAITPTVVPALDGESMAIRKLMRVALSCDHRILSGAEGAAFLQTVREVLEDPLSLSG